MEHLSVLTAPVTEAPTTALGAGSGFVVELEAFSGPLDLLLHLLREEQLEIADIPFTTAGDKPRTRYATDPGRGQVRRGHPRAVVEASLGRAHDHAEQRQAPDHEQGQGHHDLDHRHTGRTGSPAGM